jgi:hemoglobin-like flavoprotein
MRFKCACLTRSHTTQALLWTLEQGLGKLWTPEVREAWSQTYKVVQSVMEPALVAASKGVSTEDVGKRQMRLVQDSWAVIEKNLDAHGVKFFVKIFELEPSLLQLFKFRDSKDLAHSPGLHAHANAVMRIVGEAVAGLSEPETLIPVLRSLGAAHARYGVKASDFNVVGKALLWTLEQGLGDMWNGKVQEAWTHTYTKIQSVMSPALMEEANQLVLQARRQKLVLESWAIVEKDLDNNAIKFFMKVFDIAPATLQLFSFRSEPDLAKSAVLKAHASTVMRTVGQAVAGLSDVKTLIPVLQGLGEVHSKYGVQPEHLPIMGQALLLTLEETFGDTWSEDIKDAWEQAYDKIQGIIQASMVRLQRTASGRSVPSPPPAGTRSEQSTLLGVPESPRTLALVRYCVFVRGLCVVLWYLLQVCALVLAWSRTFGKRLPDIADFQYKFDMSSIILSKLVPLSNMI